MAAGCCHRFFVSGFQTEMAQILDAFRGGADFLCVGMYELFLVSLRQEFQEKDILAVFIMLKGT